MKKAYFYSEGTGMYAYGCKTPEEASEVMKKEYITWDKTPELVAEYYGFNFEDIKPENIKETRAYLHRKCGVVTIGGNDCFECNDPTTGNGRKVFALTILTPSLPLG